MTNATDNDLEKMTPEQLMAEVGKLRKVIRYHRDCKGHDRCWLDDLRLYQALPEGAAGYDGSLPPEKEFLANCREYCKSRRTNMAVKKVVEPLQFDVPAGNFCLEIDEDEEAAEEEGRLIDLDMSYDDTIEDWDRVYPSDYGGSDDEY